MELGFIKADSSNLPKLGVDMVISFFVKRGKFSYVEMNVYKLHLDLVFYSVDFTLSSYFRSTRKSYGNIAIGFV